MPYYYPHAFGTFSTDTSVNYAGISFRVITGG